MSRKIADAQLFRINELVARHLGLHFRQDRLPDLERGVCAAAEEYGSHNDLEGYIEELLSPASTPNQMEVLANHLTIGETYFFREKRSLEILEARIVPDLLRNCERRAKHFTVWSAGCATGEEPYSVAMVLSKLMPGLRDWNIEILATDVNTRSLRKASEGIYSDWSFRGTPSWVRRTHFKAAQDNNRSALLPAVKQMVSFAPLNLMDEVYPPLSNFPEGFDVIFCRNVLMYFTPEGMRKVVRQFHRHLAVGGWLIVSPTETSHELFADFATVSFDDVTFYRKPDPRLAMTRALPVRKFEPSIQRPEWLIEPSKPLGTSACCVEPAAQDIGCSPVSAELQGVSHHQALCFYEQGSYQDAGQAAAALLLQNDRDAQAMFLLARIHANRGKLAEALVWCDKAIAADKMAARFHYLRATILQEQNFIPEAIFALKQAVYADPQFVLGHFVLGNLALRDGRSNDSEKHFENVLLLLARYAPEDLVPESEGLSAGRLAEMIATPDSLRNATQSGQRHMRKSKRIGNLERSR